MSEVSAPPAAEAVHADQITPTEMPAPTVPPPKTDAAPAPKPEPPPATAAGEIDRRGVPFDPARHLHKRHPKTGCWMPRRPPAGPAAGPTNSGAESNAGAPEPSFVTAEEPPATPPEAAASPKPQESAAPPADYSGDAAEVVCRAGQSILGLLLDCPEECTPAAAEHKHMVEATAAYLRLKGWSAAPGLGLALMFAAWLLKVFQQTKPRQKLRDWFQSAKVARAKDVTPEGQRPAGSTGGAPPPGPVFDLPRGIPPLAPITKKP